MRIKNSLNSYNETTAQKYISDNTPIISISSEIEVQYNWIEKNEQMKLQDISFILFKRE